MRLLVKIALLLSLLSATFKSMQSTSCELFLGQYQGVRWLFCFKIRDAQADAVRILSKPNARKMCFYA